LQPSKNRINLSAHTVYVTVPEEVAEPETAQEPASPETPAKPSKKRRAFAKK
jgi:hypothetical protein